MTSINYAKLALIELEYSAADHQARQSATSDPLERADLSLRVRTILTAITALRLALDVMQARSIPRLRVAWFRLPVNHPPDLRRARSSTLSSPGHVANERAFGLCVVPRRERSRPSMTSRLLSTPSRITKASSRRGRRPRGRADGARPTPANPGTSRGARACGGPYPP